MKTTVELSDALMRELMEAALRFYFDSRSPAEQRYEFENYSFRGKGVCEGIEEGNWASIRSAIYEGRGG